MRTQFAVHMSTNHVRQRTQLIDSPATLRLRSRRPLVANIINNIIVVGAHAMAIIPTSTSFVTINNLCE